MCAGGGRDQRGRGHAIGGRSRRLCHGVHRSPFACRKETDRTNFVLVARWRSDAFICKHLQGGMAYHEPFWYISKLCGLILIFLII